MRGGHPIQERTNANPSKGATSSNSLELTIEGSDFSGEIAVHPEKLRPPGTSASQKAAPTASGPMASLLVYCVASPHKRSLKGFLPYSPENY